MYHQNIKEKTSIKNNHERSLTHRKNRRDKTPQPSQSPKTTPTTTPLLNPESGFKSSLSLPGKGFFILLFLLLCIAASPLPAQTVSMPSALAAPGDTIEIPVRISQEVQHIHGFQMDLTITPSPGAPSLTMNRVIKGEAVLTTPEIDTHPAVPTVETPVRIGLPVEIPTPPDPKPDFSGPGVLAWIQLYIPDTALIGEQYSLNLTSVILAGPGNLEIPVTVYGATITVGIFTIFPDTMTGPGSLTITEGTEEPLPITITGSGQPIPGIPVYFSIDDPLKAGLSAATAVTGADGILISQTDSRQNPVK